jgi:hypothetical protein
MIGCNDSYYLIYKDERSVSQLETYIDIDKITHIIGGGEGAGSAYSHIYVQGGESVSVLADPAELTEMIKKSQTRA